MNKYKIWLLGILMATCQMAIGQEQLLTSADTIPFVLTDQNNISVKAVINQLDTVDLMFHTAANDLTLIGEVAKHLKTIQWKQGDTVKSWGGEAEARYSESNTLQIGRFHWDSIGIWENKHSGPETAGKFGPNVFENKAIEIDFDENILIIHQELPEKVAEYDKLPLLYENGLLFIEGTSRIGDQAFPNQFLIHSGYGGAVLYDDKFVVESKIGTQIEITEEQELKDSYGNVLKTKKGNLPLFTIGTVQFKDIPVGFFEGAIGRQKMSVMGGNVLKRFNLVIDANRENIYIKSNGLKDSPY